MTNLTASTAPLVPSATALSIYAAAANATSITGTVCQTLGVMALIGGVLAVPFTSGGSLGVALSGFPIAALGTIACQQKRQTRLVELMAKKALGLGLANDRH